MPEERISDTTAELLLREARRINTPDFIPHDPVSFPRMYSDRRDVEIVSLLVSHISWGKREMILRDAERMLALMDNKPYCFLMEKGYNDIPDTLNIHRTFFGAHLKDFMNGLRRVYSSCGSLEEYALKRGVAESEFPAWRLAELLCAEMEEAAGGRKCPRTIPSDLATSPIKRLNMALRWLVRRDGIVDIGLWQSFSPSKLFIPLDVHVTDTSRRLGLTSRKANDRKTAVEITACLREVMPEDPVLLDFALFGLGIERNKK